MKSNLKERINSDFMTAFKAKEMDKKNFLNKLTQNNHYLN